MLKLHMQRSKYTSIEVAVYNAIVANINTSILATQHIRKTEQVCSELAYKTVLRSEQQAARSALAIRPKPITSHKH